MLKGQMKYGMRRVGIMLAVVYALIVLFMYVAQRSFLYYPDSSMPPPQMMGLSMVPEMLTTADGLQLIAWAHPPVAGAPVIVYFQGNAGNLRYRAKRFGSLIERKFGLLAVSYRGYGGNAGEPTEQGLYDDARAAINYLLQRNVPASRIVLMGESLGTGVAVQMATEFDVGALVLLSPYTSVTDRAQEIYPFLPVPLILKDSYDSISKIGSVKAPVLIIHGTADNVIPIRHAEKLLEAVTSPNKQHVWLENVDHNHFNETELAGYIQQFAVMSIGTPAEDAAWTQAPTMAAPWAVPAAQMPAQPTH